MFISVHVEYPGSIPNINKGQITNLSFIHISTVLYTGSYRTSSKRLVSLLLPRMVTRPMYSLRSVHLASGGFDYPERHICVFLQAAQIQNTPRRVCFVFVRPGVNSPPYRSSTPFGYIQSLRSKSSSKAFSITTQPAPSRLLQAARMLLEKTPPRGLFFNIWCGLG